MFSNNGKITDDSLVYTNIYAGAQLRRRILNESRSGYIDGSVMVI